MKDKKVTAMGILETIETDVNNGEFDKYLYIQDIKKLKNQSQELALLKNTLGQLRDQLPQYEDDVNSMQEQIEVIENDKKEMINNEVEHTVRFNDGFNSLMSMIESRDNSVELYNNKRSKNKKNNINNIAVKNNVKKEQNSILKKDVLLQQVLLFVEQQWVTSSDFSRLPEMMGVKELLEKIFILTEVGCLLRVIPDDMFSNGDTKQSIISAAQECLDGLIEEEADLEGQSLMDVENGFGVVGEVIADLDFLKSNANDHTVDK